MFQSPALPDSLKLYPARNSGSDATKWTRLGDQAVLAVVPEEDRREDGGQKQGGGAGGSSPVPLGLVNVRQG